MKLKLWTHQILKTFEPLAGGTMTWIADDTLDSATVRIVTDTSEPYENTAIATLVFEKGDGTEIDSVKMLVGADTVEPYAKAAGKFVHTLSLVELTKILEKFTNLHYVSTARTTLATQVSTAIENLDTLIYGKYIDHDVTGEPNYFFKLVADDNLVAMLANQQSEDYVNENATAREIFDDLFSTINARVVVTDITNDYIIKVGAIELNKTTDKTEVANKLGTFWQNNIDNFCGKIVSKVNNATPQSLVYTIDSFKSTLNTATTNDKVISTPFAVEYFKSFALAYKDEMLLEVTYTQGGEEKNKQITINYPIDLIDSKDFNGNSEDLLVDKEFWDTLPANTPTMTNYVKDNTLYYEQGADTVDVSRTFKDIVFTTNVFDTTAEKAIFRYIDRNRVSLLGGADCQITGFTTVIASSHPFAVDKWIFFASYAPFLDGVVLEATKSTKQVDYNVSLLSINDGQSDNVIDLTRYGRNLVGKAQRIGNDELSIDTNVYGFENVFEPLDKVDDYVVYKTEMQIMSKANPTAAEDKNWYKVRYSLTKGFNNLAEKIGLAREKRIYQIPLTGYRSTLPIRQRIAFNNRNFIYLSNTTEVTDRNFLSAYLIQRLVNTKPSGMTELMLMKVTASGKTFVLPIVGFGAGNTINFIARFYDNYSAGLSFVAKRNVFKWVGGNKACQNPYVNSNGVCLGFFDIAVGNTAGFNFESIKERPVLGSSDTFIGISNDNLSYTKDRAESITLQKIYSFVQDTKKFTSIGKLRIGDALIKDNYAFEFGIRPKLKLYKDCAAKYFDGNIQVFNASDGTLVGETQDFLEVKYWAEKTAFLVVKNDNTEYNNCIIADDNGNIYLAVEKLSRTSSTVLPQYNCVVLYDE
jgi:hypothetical protein